MRNDLKASLRATAANASTDRTRTRASAPSGVPRAAGASDRADAARTGRQRPGGRSHHRLQPNHAAAHDNDDHDDGQNHGDHHTGDENRTDVHAQRRGIAVEHLEHTQIDAEQRHRTGQIITEPSTTTAKATTLPFTGLDLTWVVIAGVLLVGLGMLDRGGAAQPPRHRALSQTHKI